MQRHIAYAHGALGGYDLAQRKQRKSLARVICSMCGSPMKILFELKEREVLKT